MGKQRKGYFIFCEEFKEDFSELFSTDIKVGAFIDKEGGEGKPGLRELQAPYSEEV